jgi:hypothetical protein
MPNRSTDTLFQLVHSLQKSEKRNFKLYVTRNTSGEDLKIIQLFDAIDKMQEYDETVLLKKNRGIKKTQLSNLKAHLYKQILSSLRLLENDENIDIYLHEQLDFARILYNKGLYLQSLKVLEKIKEKANAHNQISFLIQVLFLEKKIETLHITRSMEDRAEQLTKESDEVNETLLIITKLSNLALQLYSWYIKHGHARNQQEVRTLNEFFKENVAIYTSKAATFYQKLYLHQCYVWYAFIRQDFLMYYRYTQKWVDIFYEEPIMIEIETAHYIKGMHNLLNAHFDLKNYRKFDETLKQFEDFNNSEVAINNDNNRIQLFVYLNIARLNKHFLYGTFAEGVELVPTIEEKLQENWLYLDRHRILVFYYKFASLYFGNGDNDRAIDYLNKIINWKVDLRNDLQCYARLLHLIAHYEIGNYDIMDYLIRSVYRFMAKMENLSAVEEEIFKFLKLSLNQQTRELKQSLQNLLANLKQFENNPFEARAFSYLDIISWLESKVYDKPVSKIIRDKASTYLKNKKRTEGMNTLGNSGLI